MNKKILLPLLAVATLLTACEEERYDAPQLQKGVTFTVPDFIDETSTRVNVNIDNEGAHFTWTEGDTLGVFPQNGYQTAFPISDGQGTETAYFDGADWALRPNASYAAYYPFKRGMDFGKDNICISYLGQTQNGNGSTTHLGKYDYLAAKYTTVSSSGDVNFTLNHLGCLVRFQLTMPEADTYSSMTLSCEGSTLTTVGKFDLNAAIPALETMSFGMSISLALKNVTTTEANKVLTLYMMLPPMDLSGKNLSIKVSGEKDYETTVSGKDMKAGSIYGYSNIMVATTLMHYGHEYVDLGITDGNATPIYWATCNVGASAPEEYGDYFAWGETTSYGEVPNAYPSDWKDNGKNSGYQSLVTNNSPKIDYSWNTYKWGTSNNGSSILKYKDSYMRLDSFDDVASNSWSGSWRIPTLKEQKELISNCYWEWTANYHNTEVAGYIVYKVKNDLDKGVISNTESSSQKPYASYSLSDTHIFLPATGCCAGNQFYSVGSKCFYWSNSTGWYCYNARFLYASSSGAKTDDNYGRYYGFCIRPICTNPDYISITSIVVTGSKTQLTPSETLQLSATATPSDATNASITWSSSNPSVATVSAEGLVTAFGIGSATIIATANDGSGVKGEYVITVSDPYNGHEYVDLGLTSNGKPIYWATCNVGATKPEEYGDYFAWGETDPLYTEGHSQDDPCSNWKSGTSGYNWSNYKWCNGSSSTMTKYCTSSSYGTVDDKTVLDAADDAATANWGGSWRMPTRAEQDALRTNCTWTRTTKNGVNGFNVVGPNGNSIFLPAAGCRYYGNLGNAGSFGYYWSSSLYASSTDYAYYLYFDSNYLIWRNYLRYYGHSVRPVCQ